MSKRSQDKKRARNPQNAGQKPAKPEDKLPPAPSAIADSFLERMAGARPKPAKAAPAPAKAAPAPAKAAPVRAPADYSPEQARAAVARIAEDVMVNDLQEQLLSVSPSRIAALQRVEQLCAGLDTLAEEFAALGVVGSDLSAKGTALVALALRVMAIDLAQLGPRREAVKLPEPTAIREPKATPAPAPSDEDDDMPRDDDDPPGLPREDGGSNGEGE